MAHTNPMFAKRQTDYNKCYIYQKDKIIEALAFPLINESPQHDGYVMLAINVLLFHELNEMLMDPTRLDADGGIEVTLRRNQERYHMTCLLMFNNTKLDCARKRRASLQSSEVVEGQTKHHRTSHDN